MFRSSLCIKLLSAVLCNSVQPYMSYTRDTPRYVATPIRTRKNKNTAKAPNSPHKIIVNMVNRVPLKKIIIIQSMFFQFEKIYVLSNFFSKCLYIYKKCIMISQKRWTKRAHINFHIK